MQEQDILKKFFDAPVTDEDERRRQKILQILASASAGTLRMSVDRIRSLVHRAETACMEDMHKLGTDPVKRETIKALYNTFFTDIDGASFHKIPELEKQARSLAWLFRMVKMGVARPVTVSKHLGVSRKNARILIEMVKEINASPLVGTPFGGMGAEDYMAMLDYLGVSRAWEDYNRRKEAVQAVIQKVREELPDLYERVAPHIRQVCHESGLTLEFPEPPEKRPDQYESLLRGLVDKIERIEKVLEKTHRAFPEPANRGDDIPQPPGASSVRSGRKRPAT
jgi:hypothetical protein